jgi:phage tail-like protein
MVEMTPGTLHITAPDEAPQTVTLDRPVLRIGRLPAPENDLTLAHGLVSRRHAQIYCDREPYRIADLGSSNGTTVNDIPLPEGEVRELHDGDEIAIGVFTLRYTAPRRVQPVVEAAEEGAAGEGAVEEGAAEEELFAGLRLEDAPATPPPEPPIAEKAAPVTVGPESWVGMPYDRSRWLQYLPYIYSEHPFLGRFLLLFEDLFGSMDQAIMHFHLYLDPRTAPESFLGVLAGWLGLVLDDRWPAERRRAILRSAVEMYDYRGTKKGMIQLLEATTGGRVEIEENSQGPHSFRVTIMAPAEGQVDEAIVRYLIDTNKPAQTVYQLEIES